MKALLALIPLVLASFLVSTTSANVFAEDTGTSASAASCSRTPQTIQPESSTEGITPAKWVRAYGMADSEDVATSVQQTSDGGYMVAGQTTSYGAATADIWVLKLNSTGRIEWEKKYGGNANDVVTAVQQTSDGGYVVAGYTRSFGAGYDDIWILKLDSAGSITWQNTYGGDYADDRAYSIQQTSDGGYIVAGHTGTETRSWDFWVLKLDSTGGVAWQKAYGGNGGDFGTSVRQTPDGGYIVAGYTSSFGAGSWDYWVLKLNSTGGIKWQMAYGGGGDDRAFSIQPTSDGRYIVAGLTRSFGAGDSDFWVLKLYPNGGVQWQKSYGGSGGEDALSVRQTSDGGYLVAGGGWGDSLVMKLYPNGNVNWQIRNGGSEDDVTNALSLTSDGGFVLAGSTMSFDAGNRDFWVLKFTSGGATCIPSARASATVTTSSATVSTTTGDHGDTASVLSPTSVEATTTTATVTGTCHWAATYGGGNDDLANSVRQTSDGGYIVAGYTPSFGAGLRDVWVLKLNSAGSVQWARTYGGSLDDEALSVQQTSDNGYIVAGYTNSFGAGNSDFWVLKLNSAGGITWQKAYGGGGEDRASSVQQTSDGRYIVAGYTTSFGAGGSDFWVLKLYPYGGVEWQKTYGGGGEDRASSVQQTSDGRYIVAGYTSSFGTGDRDFWVLKLYPYGGVQWQRTYGGTNRDEASSVQQTTDNGYIVAGYTTSFGVGGYDIWVIKLNSTGGKVWWKSYGGSQDDKAFSVQQTNDGGYVVAGNTVSFGGGLEDAWILRLYSTGTVKWQKTYGANGLNGVYSIQQTTDRGYIVAGYWGGVWFDVWVLRLDSTGSIPACPFMGTSSATVAGTPATITTTSVSGTDTSATVTATTASPGADIPGILVQCI